MSYPVEVICGVIDAVQRCDHDGKTYACPECIDEALKDAYRAGVEAAAKFIDDMGYGGGDWMEYHDSPCSLADAIRALIPDGGKETMTPRKSEAADELEMMARTLRATATKDDRLGFAGAWVLALRSAADRCTRRARRLRRGGGKC